MSEAPFLGRLLLAFGGLIVWAAHFGAAYGFVAIGCARNVPDIHGVPITTAAVGAATVLAALAVIGLLLANRRVEARFAGPPTAFLRATAIAVTALALLAIGWNTLPVILLPVCA